jgi:hypothetical protein
MAGTDADNAVLQMLWPSSLLVAVNTTSLDHRRDLAFVDLLALQCLSGLTSTSKSNTNSTLLLADTDRATSPARSLRVLSPDPQSPVMS